jgi:hypothetical protein
MSDHSRYYLVDDGNKSVEEVSMISKQVGDKPPIDNLEEQFSADDVPRGISLSGTCAREIILDSWLSKASSRCIFGRHWSGKTWFAPKMAISKGEDFDPWKCHPPWKTLDIDGEITSGP